MLAATIGDQACWLLPYSPNTDDKVRLGVKVPVKLVRGLTGRTSRSPDALLPRYSLEWSAALLTTDFDVLRNATQTAQDEPMLAPVWPFATRAADAAVITAGLRVAWTEDWATWAINPESLDDYDYVAPLLYGRLAQLPSLAAQGDNLVTVDFSVEEDGPADYAFAPAEDLLPDDTTFATLGGFAAPIFPFFPDWGSAPKPGTAVTAVERAVIGPGRQKAIVFYPQTPELVQEASFKFPDAASAAQLLAWWIRRAGIADPHWVAGTQALGRLSAAAPAGTRELNFREAIAPGGNLYVALFSPDGTAELGRIAATAAQQITLAADLVNDWGPSLANVTLAILARHTADELVLQFQRSSDGWIADSTLAWREVAPEYAPPEGETRGTTLGRLPASAWFFQIDLDYNGALQSWYLTNWESGAHANDLDWAYNPCSFDKLLQSLDLEDDSCSVSFRWFAGGPWDNWLPGQLAARGYITISRADVDAAGAFSNFAQVWKGEMKTPTLDGPLVKQKAIGANALFARATPRQVMSRTCGTMLFSTRCGLALADWVFDAVITGVSGNLVTIGTITRHNGDDLPDGFGAADWFALGWMGWLVDGRPLRDGVLASSLLDSGEIALTLERGSILEIGTAVTAMPGCDRQGATCRDKFDNYDNFRGFEFMPSVSPSLVIPQRATSAKK